MSGTTYYQAEEESVIFTTKKMKEGEEVIHNNRKIYLNMWGEYCVCHLWGGMVAYNAGFDSQEKAMIYIDIITKRHDLRKEEFQKIADEVKRCIAQLDSQNKTLYLKRSFYFNNRIIERRNMIGRMIFKLIFMRTIKILLHQPVWPS